MKPWTRMLCMRITNQLSTNLSLLRAFCVVRSPPSSARRVIDGQNGDVRNRLQSLGARFSPLKNGAQSLGEAAILPPAGPLTLAERERQAITTTLQDTSGKLAETARRLGISRTTLWRRLKSYGMDGFRASP